MQGRPRDEPPSPVALVLELCPGTTLTKLPFRKLLCGDSSGFCSLVSVECSVFRNQITNGTQICLSLIRHHKTLGYF